MNNIDYELNEGKLPKLVADGLDIFFEIWTQTQTFQGDLREKGTTKIP